MPTWLSSVVTLIGSATTGVLPRSSQFDKGDQAAVILELHLLRRGVPLVPQDDFHAGVEEGQLPQPPFEDGEVELGLGERAATGLERDLRAGVLVAGAHDAQWLRRVAMLEPDKVLGAVLPDAHLHPFG